LPNDNPDGGFPNDNPDNGPNNNRHYKDNNKMNPNNIHFHYNPFEKRE
tara:strand:+ start:124 stop:267 length:144 start_codon:yes stop_codon:yes gene_type:complete